MSTPLRDTAFKKMLLFFPFPFAVFFLSLADFSPSFSFSFLVPRLFFFLFSPLFFLSPLYPCLFLVLLKASLSLHFLTSVFLLFVYSICPFLFLSPSSSFIFIFFIYFSLLYVNVLILPLPLASPCFALYLFPSLSVVRVLAFVGVSDGLISLLFLTVAVVTMIIFTEYGELERTRNIPYFLFDRQPDWIETLTLVRVRRLYGQLF